MADLLKFNRTVVLDGATGTRLKEVYPNLRSEDITLKDPDLVEDIHKGYVAAGSDVILTNTFGLNPRIYDRRFLEEIISSAVRIARKAGNGKVRVAGDIGPSGRLIEPFGNYPLEDAIADFSLLSHLLVRAGVDLLYLETFTSLIEARAALLGARRFKIPVFVTLTFDDNLRTPFGDLPESCALILESLGANAAGVNCTTPEIVIEVLKRMRGMVSIPLIGKPNRGRPKGDSFTYSHKEMVSFVGELSKVADIVGGCCGTGPEFIKAVYQNRRRLKRKKKRPVRALASPRKVITLNHPILVGERINPTGRKQIIKALKDRNYDLIVSEALIQEERGAEAVDLNLFTPGVDERVSMVGVIKRIPSRISVPIFIDTKDLDAAEAALRYYPGVGILNSIRPIKTELGPGLKLAKSFGSYVVISLSKKRIPKTKEEALKLYRLAKRSAQDLGFPTERLIYDPLVLPIGVEPDRINLTLEVVRELKKMGELSILGISNVSFGMPDRSILNAGLIPAAIHAGADFLIANPLDMKVTDAFTGSVQIFTGKRQFEKVEFRDDLSGAILSGDIGRTRFWVEKECGDPIKVINQKIIPALSEVGMRYEEGKFFLPQLLASAQAAKTAMDILKKRFKSGRVATEEKVVLATVEGDIHDLGKNIVRMILESHGIQVIDLGVNVSIQKIIETIKKKNVKVLGLSALMTTSMARMAEAMAKIKREGLKVSVIVGGGPVDQEFARRIGADYAADAVSGVKLIRRYLGAQG